MKRPSRQASLAWLLVSIAFTTSYSGAQSLPDGWWLQNTPEKILAKAQAINLGVTFFYGKKLGSTISQNSDPVGKTNANARVELFQRKSADGFVETKRFLLDGKFQWTVYILKSGEYVSTLGPLIKVEYVYEDAEEISNAVKFDHPYEFKILKSKMVGTNDCIVIARCMTTKFLDAMKGILYKNRTKEQEASLGGDFRTLIHSEIDYYFRKSDGVTFGLTKRNHLGEQLEDWVYSNVEINQPIPDQEFLLPKGEIKIARTPGEYGEILMPSVADPKVEKRVSELLWALDLPTALAQAKAENKIVLVDFTGSDWCMWCRKFDNDVLSQPEFASYAKTNLVMVMLDFPNAKPQSDAVKKANKNLKEKFKMNGFPTYVVLTPDGKEIGRQVGYLHGGPQAFIAELDKFRKQ